MAFVPVPKDLNRVKTKVMFNLTKRQPEKQISGRNISLNIDYEDVLNADNFNEVLLNEE